MGPPGYFRQVNCPMTNAKGSHHASPTQHGLCHKQFSFSSTPTISKPDVVISKIETPETWRNIHDSVMIDKHRELFEADLISSQTTKYSANETNITLQLDKKCMTELKLLDGTTVLSVFDSGSTVNLISEAIIAQSKYLSNLPIVKCEQFNIINTSTTIQANRFIELCFKVNEDYILNTTALIVPDFGVTKFILSTRSMAHLQGVLDFAKNRITIRKSSFAFHTMKHCKIKPHDTLIVPIRCFLPAKIQNGTQEGLGPLVRMPLTGEGGVQI
jgi:hypothetical protein